SSTLRVVCAVIAGCASPGLERSATPQPSPASAEPPGTTEDQALPEPAGGSEEDAPAALRQTTRTGFLKDYSRLRAAGPHKYTMIERRPSLAAYRTFLVQTPRVTATRTVGGKPIDAESAAELASSLKAAATAALGTTFTVTDRPGEGVAVIRCAVTQVGECAHGPGSDGVIGGASVEMEIVDSITGERLGAAVESDAVTTRDPQLRTDDPWHDARLVFQHWSARLAKWLNDGEP
ncbi:MAG: DUF3313 domain-containing protein, partial [Thermoleophilia bacterium]|nr:DUF3313 domain-containing protein [Thermoleophilia bacterium]